MLSRTVARTVVRGVGRCCQIDRGDINEVKAVVERLVRASDGITARDHWEGVVLADIIESGGRRIAPLLTSKISSYAKRFGVNPRSVLEQFSDQMRAEGFLPSDFGPVSYHEVFKGAMTFLNHPFAFPRIV